jgi:acetyl esterase/lipase
MIGKWLKKILLSAAGLLVLLFLFLLIPRIWSAMTPGKAPLGYYFEKPVYAAVWLGLEKLVNLTPEIPPGLKEIKNIEYKNINGKSLQMDMYIPDTIRNPAPLLVFIHGGGWRGGKRTDYLGYLIDFAEKGYITTSVSYRLLSDSCYPACVQDISDAIDWLFQNGDKYGYDTSRIALVGGSAGGHLSMLGAYGWNKEGNIGRDAGNHHIKAVVDIYGPYDLTTEYACHHSLVTTFLAHSYEDDPQLYALASPKHYLDERDPPTMILHGTSDTLVPISQSDSLAARLKELGIPYVYYKIPGWPHAMDIVKRVNDYCQLKMNGFFDEYLR